MPEKSDKELAVELTVAMLNHNANIHSGNPSGGIGLSNDNVKSSYAIGANYAYLLGVVQGKTDPYAYQKKNK